MQSVLNYLDNHQIEYKIFEHPAAFTCEEVEEHCSHIPGMACKNLFIKNRKGKRFFLLVLSATKMADIKQFGREVGQSGLTFANADNLKKILNLEPGSVSPFGLLNDQNEIVEVYIDEEVYHAEVVNFHPNRNTATLALTGEMFRQFLNILPHQVNVISIP
ncbi:MAG: prolyl-tRNA synthetase associated domain-containing protein [Chitinophagales bacterium]